MRRTLSGLWILVFLALLSGCSERGAEPASATVFAMDTFITVAVYGDRAQEAVEVAVEEIHRLERLFSVTREDSDVARINTGDSGPVRVSPETAALLSEALALWAETEGAFSPGLYTVLRAWGFTTEERRVPDEAEIESLLAAVSVGDIVLDGQMVYVPAGMELDLGGIAKGFAADVLGEKMREMGVESAIFSLGGDVLVVGERERGGAWRVAVQNPFGSGYLGVFEVVDAVVTTSGSYARQFVEEAGLVYHHILDPETGRPVQNELVSVTALTSRGTRGDALATALFVMGLEDGAAFVREAEDLEAVFVTADGRVYATSGLQGVFHLEGDAEVTWL